ncbi:MAG: hypothetical protein WCP45_18480 [Verrucomicrobiota bacterium]
MKPITPLAIIRRRVREVLAMAPGYGKTEAMLLEFANELNGGGISLQELRDARDWNHAEGYIRSEDDDESVQVLWFITPAGMAKQKTL